MKVDVHCTHCGQDARLDVGAPAPGQTLEEYLHLVRERLLHRPSFECFGGHMELRPPLPGFWEIDWSSLGDE
ncbi:MAG TPA: hypothetical protein VNO26_03590 [Candidatus Limnocylindria bacterium]|nr:hypothetical protein [Candidatus Limnocylindria bacterium]